MTLFRREFLKLAGAAAFAGSALAFAAPGAKAQAVRPPPNVPPEANFDVRRFGAVGDGKAIDSPAVNRAIDAAAAAGGGVVMFTAGTYACYTIRLKSRVMLYVGPGATILAASTPMEGTTSGYDPAESNAPWESYQDYGHNHWHNSLIRGEGLTDIAIMGPGLIWGKGLSRGGATADLPDAEKPGVGNKAISLKNCRNVILRDVSMLACGHFALLATGVDNLTIDNLKIDTNRDGLDIDCCKNVHISNCSINSPWDDAITPKSSFALGYARVTENVSITGCYVTGDYQMGTMLDGTFKRFGPPVGGVSSGAPRAGRIKAGTESNGGFKNITVSGCIFESCAGFALETVDGAIIEDITFTGVTMRDIVNAPFFFRLGARMRGPKGVPMGTFKRVIVSGVSCYGARADMPSLLAGLPDHPIEDIKIADLYLEQPGGGTPAMAAARPPEHATDYPKSSRWGALPAGHFYVRHARNLELSHVEVALKAPDPRPLFWLEDVAGFDSYGLKTPRGRKGPTFQLNNVRDLRVLDSRALPDLRLATVAARTI